MLGALDLCAGSVDIGHAGFVAHAGSVGSVDTECKSDILVPHYLKVQKVCWTCVWPMCVLGLFVLCMQSKSDGLVPHHLLSTKS